MSDILGRIKTGAEKAVKEADRVAHVKLIELDISSIKNQIEIQYKKLGEIAYKSSANKEPENPEAAGIIAKINGLNEQIKVKEEEIKKINQGESVPQVPTTPGKKVCSNCGKENDASVKFCSDCGTKRG